MTVRSSLFLLLGFSVAGAASLSRRSVANGDTPPEMAKPFLAFVEDGVEVEWDDSAFYVGGNTIPAHNMMKGITSWQQQLPIPQPFTGENAHQVPLNPKKLDEPGELNIHGAIAIALNGIPIFHPLTQSGKDAFLGGELDEWGGHCGRADDYHYHIAPAHLEEVIGKGNPVAYGLDGYPIHVADPAVDKELDECHGYVDDAGNYRYVSSPEFPYMMGAYRGEVDHDSRPKGQGIRPHLAPLRGASITDFNGSLEDGFHLTYEAGGKVAHIRYQVEAEKVHFQFVDPDGTEREETHSRSSRRPGAAPKQRNEFDQEGGGGQKPPKPQGGKPKGKDGKDGKEGKGGKSDKGSGRPAEPGRSPWVLAHALELDANGDTVVTRAEVEAEVARVYQGQANGERVRSALSGFLKQHAGELDTDEDGSVSQEEAAASFTRMFDKTDSDGDGRITKEQYEGHVLKEGERPPKK